MHLLLSMLLSFAAPTETEPFFPTAPPTASALCILDMREATLDQKLTATTLQGLVNRGETASLYVLLAPWDVFWLEQLKQNGYHVLAPYLDLEAALSKFSDRIKTLIVHDPALPASINLATMIASLEGGIVVAPTDVYAGLKQPRQDLAGRWKSNSEAYRWALEMLLPRMNPDILACYHPSACAHHLRDYLVQHRVFHFWVTSEEKADGLTAHYQDELDVAKAVFKATRPNIPVLGFWYSNADKGLNEYAGVGLASEYGKITVVCDWATNLSVHGGVKSTLAQDIARYQERIAQPAPKLEADKIYICFDIVESGDSPSYMQGRQYEVWEDTDRGAIPINWSLGPALLDLAPGIAAYYYREASPNDYLYMAISGAGYCQPYLRLHARTPEPQAAWREYLNITRDYLGRMQCTTLGLYTDAWKPFDRAKHDPVTRRFLEGLPEVTALVLGMGRDEGVPLDAANYRAPNDGPAVVSHIMTRWPTDYGSKTREENIAWLAQDIRAHTPTLRPAFMHVMALSWVFGPAEIRAVMQELGDGYVPLTIPAYTRLYRDAVN